jgi:hypothetical protein
MLFVQQHSQVPFHLLIFRNDLIEQLALQVMREPAPDPNHRIAQSTEIRSVVIRGKSLPYPFDLSLRLAVWSNKGVSIAILTTVLLKACF